MGISLVVSWDRGGIEENGGKDDLGNVVTLGGAVVPVLLQN
jgi:hypothetical protein